MLEDQFGPSIGVHFPQLTWVLKAISFNFVLIGICPLCLISHFVFHLISFLNITVDQYVAVGAHKHMNELHTVNCEYSGKHLLQIWCMGQLHNDGLPHNERPYLSLGLVHENAFVWDLQWCPRGSPVSSESTPFLNASNQSANGLFFSFVIQQT
jgi:hypothetical protein